MRCVDIAVIGAGPAGLAAAQYAARANLFTVVFEKMSCGGQMVTIDEIANYPGMPEPVAGYDLAMLFQSQAEKFGAEICYAEVKKIQKDGNLFHITADDGITEAKAVIIATGTQRRPLDVPGEKEYAGHGVSYCATCDGPFFKGKKMLVVGGGDAACQEALYLTKLSDEVTLIHRRDEFRAQQGIVELCRRNEKLRIMLSTTLSEIRGDGKKVTSVVLKDVKTGKEHEESMDAVFGFTGNNPQSSLAPVQTLDAGKFIVTNNLMETGIKGLYAVGDVRNTSFRQVVTAANDGAVASHAAAEYIRTL